jgi:hypothetical protein
MQHATHGMQHATHGMQHATHGMQHAAHDMQHATHGMQHATHGMQHGRDIFGEWFRSLSVRARARRKAVCVAVCVTIGGEGGTVLIGSFCGGVSIDQRCCGAALPSEPEVDEQLRHAPAHAVPCAIGPQHQM